jgi:hypothetical protein
MSGYRLENMTDGSTDGEALLFRTLPLNVPVISVVPFSTTPLYGGSINFRDIHFPFVDAIIASSADGTASSVYARKVPVVQECMLSWCVKTIQSSYASGNYEETITDTYLNTTAREQPYPWHVEQVPKEHGFFTSFGANISIYPPSRKGIYTEFGVSQDTFEKTQALFDDMFPSSITVANATALPWWRVRIYAWGRNQLRNGTSCSWLAPNNITQYLDRLATSMTNTIRSHPSHEFVQGRAYFQTTFIVVHWAWLTFPLALLVACLVFLVATMIKTSDGYNNGLGMWKTSAMPTLIYSLPREVQKCISDPAAWGNSASEKKQKVKIRLLPDSGWRVSGHIRRPTSRAPPGWI